MDKHIIKRDGLPPISFTGEKIGAGSTRGHNTTRWTNVDIFRTQGGRYIVSVSRLTQWEGESDHRQASSLASPAEVIEHLKEGLDELGSASQEAVERAVKEDPLFAAAWIEEVA